MRLLRFRSVPSVRCSAWLLLILLAATPPVSAAEPKESIESIESIESNEPIEIRLDATAVTRNLLQATLTIPAESGPLTLVYPKWIQGEHGPTGPIVDLVGLKFTADGEPLLWRRDDFDAFAFHLNVPEGVDSLSANVEFLVSSEKTGFSRAASTTAHLAILNWNQFVLHPQGAPIAEQSIRASLTVPEGWKVGTALPVAGSEGATTRFQPVSVETLCDSPVICGEFYKEIAIGPSGGGGGGTKHYLCMVADSPKALEVPDEVKSALDRLVVETQAVFGDPPYGSYRFLVALSDHIGHYGMEHHESSDNRGPEGMLTDPLYRKTWHAWLLSHEFVHAWNGKYRRPAGMSPSDHQQPLRTRLLWVYEGLTQYYGLVLAARSGMWQPEIARDNFARIAARAVSQTGRDWRSLEDTAVAAHYQYRASRPEGWYRRRGVDFYDEAAMVWLEADAIIREQTNGEKSLDDFCKLFYSGGDGVPRVEPYELKDVISTLDRVVPYDWAGFLEERVQRPGAAPPVGGLTKTGWELAFTSEPTELYSSAEQDTKKIDLSNTLGLILLESGVVEDVVPNLPADQAGVAAGMKLVAVDHRRWTPEIVKKVIANSRDGGTVALLFEKNDLFQTLVLNYADGGKYPTLVRMSAGAPDRLSKILSSQVTDAAAERPGGAK